MSIDMDALRRASEGDPSAKVTVSKKWLAEVHRLLAGAERRDRASDMLASIAERMMGGTGAGRN